MGDPFKDTSGPALNVLIKLMSLVSLVLSDRLRSAYPTEASVLEGFSTEGTIISVVTLVVGVGIAASARWALRFLGGRKRKGAEDGGLELGSRNLKRSSGLRRDLCPPDVRKGVASGNETHTGVVHRISTDDL